MAKTPQDGHCWPSWEGDPYNLGDKQLGQQFRAFLPKTAKTAKAFPPGGSPARRHTKPRRVCGRAILQHFYIFRGDRVHSCFCTPRSQALPGNALCQRLRLARQSLEGSGFPGRAWESAFGKNGNAPEETPRSKNLANWQTRHGSMAGTNQKWFLSIPLACFSRGFSSFF